MEPKNRTPEDAHQRIVQAQIGAHVDASDTFLIALRAKLYLWIANIDAELAARIERGSKCTCESNGFCRVCLADEVDGDEGADEPLERAR